MHYNLRTTLTRRSVASSTAGVDLASCTVRWTCMTEGRDMFPQPVHVPFGWLVTDPQPPAATAIVASAAISSTLASRTTI
jgi:hypothetical protein